MEESIVKEDISYAYLAACCASANIAFERITHDEDGEDCCVKKICTRTDGGKYNAALTIQMKSTSSDSQYTVYEDRIVYRLKAKNYNDLCTPGTNPFILGLLVLPGEREEWVNWTPEELLLRGTMYWERFDSREKSENTGTVSVSLPKANLLGPETLNAILQRIAEEEW